MHDLCFPHRCLSPVNCWGDNRKVVCDYEATTVLVLKKASAPESWNGKCIGLCLCQVTCRGMWVVYWNCHVFFLCVCLAKKTMVAGGDSNLHLWRSMASLYPRFLMVEGAVVPLFSPLLSSVLQQFSTPQSTPHIWWYPAFWDTVGQVGWRSNRLQKVSGKRKSLFIIRILHRP